MSAMTNTQIRHARERGSASRERATLGDEAEYAATKVGTPAIYGPPVSFLLGPWLFLVLLLVPPFAFVVAIGLALAVAAVLLAAVAAVVASPYLLVRHVRTRRSEHAQPAAAPQPSLELRAGSRRIGSPQVKGAS